MYQNWDDGFLLRTVQIPNLLYRTVIDVRWIEGSGSRTTWWSKRCEGRYSGSLSKKLEVRPGLAPLPAHTALTRLLRGQSVDPPEHIAWLRPVCGDRPTRNYGSQKAVRVQEGSGGGGRKGASHCGGGCPLCDRFGNTRDRDGGRGPERTVQPWAPAGASQCLRPQDGPGRDVGR